MASPFPGMDPYLEHPDLWPDVHSGLIALLREVLSPLVRPRYFVGIEQRVYLTGGEEELVGLGDVTVSGSRRSPRASRSRQGAKPVEVRVPVPVENRETFLEVRAPRTRELVTVIEILSPANKRHGKGRLLYRRKRERVLGSLTNLVEIDLLRLGEPMTVYPARARADYSVLVSRGDRRPRADLLPFTVRDPIPEFALPLRPGDDEPPVRLGAVLSTLYERAGYDLILDYAAEPEPPLRPRAGAWARRILAR